MLHLNGISVSEGYSSGIAVIYDLGVERRIELPRQSISHSQVASEYDRLEDALEQSTDDLERLESIVSTEPRLVESSGLMSAQSALARDIALLVKQHIGQEFVNVEHALNAVLTNFVTRFGQVENAYFRQREQDIRDVGQRMMRHLASTSSWAIKSVPPGSVIVARELLPSETVELVKSGIVAIVSEYGGEFSHTAILARSLGIPAITGIADVTSLIKPGMRLLVDGETGCVMESTQSEIERFAVRKREYEARGSLIAIDENLPCVTRDGIEVSLMSNVCLPAEIAAVANHHLAGVGLFRTEFLYLESHERPTFEMQLKTYTNLAVSLGDRPLVIRTFDLGGDKLPPFLLSESPRAQSRIHLRGLRFSLAEQELLNTQLRAILQAAQTSDIRILFPMVIGSDDFGRAIAAVERTADELGVFRRPPIGAMIETPATLFDLDRILELADFVAIGTNDLTQYMLAADRASAEGTDDCTAMHPAVLRAIKQVVEAAEEFECPLCVCGEEAGNAAFACLLVGLGVRELSMTPVRSAPVRHALRCLNSRAARETADLALLCQTPREVRDLCQEFATPASVSARTGGDKRNAAVVECVATAAAPAVQFLAATDDSRQSRRQTNQALRTRVAETTARLSEANRSLTRAARESRLSAVAFEALDSTLITDEMGTILRVNKSFTNLTGYTPEDVIGKTPRILKSGRQPEDFYRKMWQAVRNQGSWQGEVWNQRKDGTVFLQGLSLASVKNEFGAITHYVGNGHDLTRQKEGDLNFAAIQAAREVQRKLFPRTAPGLPNFDIAGAVHSAEGVGGDFFDFIPLGKNSVGLLVADVSGHGLGPALLMAQAQASLRALADTYSDPADLLARVNRLFTASDSDHFITMFLGRLDLSTRSFVYQRAGHQAYLIGEDGTVQVLRATSIPVGLLPDLSACAAPEIILKRGDILAIPTDGAEEATNRDGQQFGRKQLLRILKENRTQSAAQLVEILFRSARNFSGEQPQLDDITVLIVKTL